MSSENGRNLIKLIDAVSMYRNELDHQKRINNAYSWYRSIAKERKEVHFSDVSDRRGGITLTTRKIAGVWYIDKELFLSGLAQIKLNTRDYKPVINKWWKE